MSQDGSGCKECKRLREHVASLLPFKVLESMSGKPLSIRGVAICSGMSRNYNIYTTEELQAFTSKLVSAPVYIEHVAVPNAIGKVTKTDWDGHKYSPFAEKAGMKKIAQQQTVEGISSVSKALSELGFDTQLLASERYVTSKLVSLQPEQIDRLKEAFIKNSHTRFRREFAASRHQPFGKASDYVKSVQEADIDKIGNLVKLVGMLSQTKVYLFWER